MKPLILALLLLSSCTQDILGLNRGQRLQLYGAALDLSGNPEIGAPVAALGRRLTVIDKQPVNVNPSGK